MSSCAWKCRNAELEVRFNKATKRYSKTKGHDNFDYRCKVKEFLSQILPPQVGCWEDECQNYHCKRIKECQTKMKVLVTWCDQGLRFQSERQDIKHCSCYGHAEDCPFFKPRDKASWIEAARNGLVPFLKEDGKLRLEAKSAILKFDIPHKVVVKLIQRELEARKYLKEHFAKEKKRNEEA